MSDNAKTFKHCSKEILKIAQAEEVCSYLTNKQIEWRFIVEKAPWWGAIGKGLFKVLSVVLKRPLDSSDRN